MGLTIFYRCVSDPLVHHGRHFGRTVHALCNVNALITNGILRLGELADEPEEAFTSEYAPLNSYDITWILLLDRERREHKVFQALLNMIPGLEERIMTGSSEEIRMIGDLVRELITSPLSCFLLQ